MVSYARVRCQLTRSLEGPCGVIVCIMRTQTTKNNIKGLLPSPSNGKRITLPKRQWRISYQDEGYMEQFGVVLSSLTTSSQISDLAASLNGYLETGTMGRVLLLISMSTDQGRTWNEVLRVDVSSGGEGTIAGFSSSQLLT